MSSDESSDIKPVFVSSTLRVTPPCGRAAPRGGGVPSCPVPSPKSPPKAETDPRTLRGLRRSGPVTTTSGDLKTSCDMKRSDAVCVISVLKEVSSNRYKQSESLFTPPEEW